MPFTRSEPAQVSPCMSEAAPEKLTGKELSLNI